MKNSTSRARKTIYSSLKEISNQNWGSKLSTKFFPAFILLLFFVFNLNGQITHVFNYTGTLQSWTVPPGVHSITIEASGAQGGATYTVNGGLGAKAQGTFAVNPGEQLTILVGQQGTNSPGGSAGGGGGGSFVAKGSSFTNNNLLIAAGGGGGRGARYPGIGQVGGSGQSGSSGTDGGDGGCGFGCGGDGGMNGNGGFGGTGGGGNPGAAGAGYLTDGGDAVYGGIFGGQAIISGGASGTGGNPGGFGGGGAGGNTSAGGAGGGGGYSGGGGGSVGGATGGGGGGGGSFNIGTNSTILQGVNSGNGIVKISYITVTHTFSYSGQIETWIVPECIHSIKIEAKGAQGGSTYNIQGGLGAKIEGIFAVNPGEQLNILVGEQGTNSPGGSAGGGGGGSFVAKGSSFTNNNLLIAAGGGGGRGARYPGIGQVGGSGQSGSSGTDGGDGGCGFGCGGDGGMNGNGGFGGTGGGGNPGAAGAGYLTDGGDAVYGGIFGGQAIISGGAGGTGGNPGGFGGGGAGGNTSAGGAGGGGGYSGGGGGSVGGATGGGGGGGGSFNSGTSQSNMAGINSGNGEIIISYDLIGVNTTPCNQPPSAVCQSLTVSADADCQAHVSPSQFDGGSTDPEWDPLSFNISPTGPFSPGSTTVILTVSDGNLTSSCSTTITVEDNTKPSLSCPTDFTQNNDPGVCGAIVSIPAPLAYNDNCGVTYLKGRVRPIVDGVAGAWGSFQDDPSGYYEVGNYEVQWRAKDASNNKKNCKFNFEVLDAEAPNAVCLHPTITFNGESNIDLLGSDLFDALASSDNCSAVSLVDFDKLFVICEEVGSMETVTVTVQDEAGNTAQCTSNVTVSGLPCGWVGEPGGIDCTGGSQPTYDPNTSTYTLSGEGCNSSGYYSNSDAQAFMSTELCGDGEIIAEVTQVIGDGFAGIGMREDPSPGAKMFQLGIDGVLLTKREMRMTTGALAFNHLFQTQGKNWLKLSRAGSTFTAEHSSDGINWSLVIVSNIPMSNCLEVGMYVENAAATGAATGVFENVQINTVAPLTAPDQWESGQVEISNQMTIPSISVYPNPAKDIVNIDLEGFAGQAVTITIFDKIGKVVRSLDPEKDRVIEQIPLHDLPPGTYFLNVKSKDFSSTKRFIMLSD